MALKPFLYHVLLLSVLVGPAYGENTPPRYEFCSALLRSPWATSNFIYGNAEEKLLVESTRRFRMFVDDNDVDFSSTHLALLTPLTRSIRAHLLKALEGHENNELLEQSINELDSHLEHGHLTYAWLIPFAEHISRVLDFEDSRLVKTSKIGPRFVTERPNNPTLGLPGFGDLSRAAINHMTAKRVWPLGETIKPSWADMELILPSQFHRHDRDHMWLAHQYVMSYPKKTENLKTAIESGIVDTLDRLNVDLATYIRLNVIHFHIFHEVPQQLMRNSNNLHLLDISVSIKTKSKLARDDFFRAIDTAVAHLTPVPIHGNGTYFTPTADDYMKLTAGSSETTDENVRVAREWAKADGDLYRAIANYVIDNLDLPAIIGQ